MPENVLVGSFGAKLQKLDYIIPITATYLNTIGGCWYFWKGIWASKAHKPVTLPENATFTKV